MLIIFLIVAYFVVRVIDKLNRFHHETPQNIVVNKIMRDVNYYVPIYNDTHTIRLKRQILRTVYDNSIPSLEKPDILVKLMIELHEYEDTSEFIDTFPEIHSKIFKGEYQYE